MYFLKSAAALLGISLMYTTNAVAVNTQQLKLPPVKLNISSALTADLIKPVKKPARIRAGSIQWNCRAKQCRAKEKWPNNPLQACKSLVIQTSKIKKFSLAKQSLNKFQIQQCNMAKPVNKMALLKNKSLISKKTGALPKATDSSIARKQPGRTTYSTPVFKGTQKPSAIINTLPRSIPRIGTPSPDTRGSDGRPSNRDAAQAIRDAAANLASQARIQSATPVESANGCVRDTTGRGAEFILRGRRFGANSTGRKIVLATEARGRFTFVAEASVVSWSNTRIVARIPYRNRNILQGRHYVVGIQNMRSRWVSNTSRQLRVCPDHVSINGKITMDLCTAGLNNIKLELTVNGAARRDVSVSAVSGDSFAMQYNINLPASANMNVVLTPKLVGASCPGGVWTPGSKRLSLGYSQTRATQDFNYHVGLQVLPIPMTAIAAIIQTKFTGLQMRINNYDPTVRLRKANDTRLTFPAELGGGERVYDILPVVSGPRTYYVNDINLNNVRVSATASGLKLSLNFENAGTEFIGFCKPSNIGDEFSCALGTPSVQASLSVDIYLTLERYLSRGAPVSISFGNVRVVARPNTRVDGICGEVDICNLITNYKLQIKSAIESSLSAALNTTAVRDQVANALLPTLRGMRIGRVNSARVEGRNFVIKYIPAE